MYEFISVGVFVCVFVEESPFLAHSCARTKQTINVTVELGYMTAKANIANNCVWHTKRTCNRQPCTMNANDADVDADVDDDFAKTNGQSKTRRNSYMKIGKAPGSMPRRHKHAYTHTLLAGYRCATVCVGYIAIAQLLCLSIWTFLTFCFHK